MTEFKNYPINKKWTLWVEIEEDGIYLKWRRKGRHIGGAFIAHAQTIQMPSVNTLNGGESFEHALDMSPDAIRARSDSKGMLLDHHPYTGVLLIDNSELFPGIGAINIPFAPPDRSLRMCVHGILVGNGKAYCDSLNEWSHSAV